jgi:hypothetical protein
MGSRNPYPKPENPKLLVLEKGFFRSVDGHNGTRTPSGFHPGPSTQSQTQLDANGAGCYGVTDAGQLRSLAIETLDLLRSHLVVARL